jgi:Flp pilus assembly protein CpaB
VSDPTSPLTGPPLPGPTPRSAPGTPPSVAARTPRRLEFGRRLAPPTARAVTGGLLVTAAALGAITTANGDPSPPPPRRVVAAVAVAPGQRLTIDDLALAPVVHTDHDDSLFDRPDELDGAIALAPLSAGDVVQASAVRRPELVGTGPAPAGDGTRVELTVRLERSRALAGRVAPGELIDLVATFGSGLTAETDRVAADALVVRVDALDEVTAAGELAVTLAVDDDAVVAVTHAADVGELTVVRRSATGAGR